MRNFASFVLPGVLLLSFILASFSAELALGISTTERNRDFFGVGEPLLYRSDPTKENLNVTKTFEIMESLGVGKLREWVWRQLVFKEDGTELNHTVVERLRNIVLEAKSLNITVMGMVQDFPRWMTGIDEDTYFQQAIPERNSTEGSPYREFIQKYQRSWEVLATELPEIELWEIGNEYNLPQFLHPPGYDPNITSTRFSPEEQVNIVTDLLYYGSRGIHAGNPQAITVMCGLAPGGNGIDDIKSFLECIYKKIKSGNWPSTNPDDFFQVACWHPYLGDQEATVSNWIIPNQAVYGITEDYDNKCKPVVFSEFGYSDNETGLSEEQIAEYLNTSFALAENSLQPWLKAIYWFRLVDPDPKFDAGLNQHEYGFGLVKPPSKDYDLKQAAHAYATIEEYPSPLLLAATIILASSAIVLVKTCFTKKRCRQAKVI